jgi:hypothetical protein
VTLAFLPASAENQIDANRSFYKKV